MSLFEGQTIKIECPSCRRSSNPSTATVLNIGEFRCSCGATQKFSPVAISNLRTAIYEMEQMQRKLERAKEALSHGAVLIQKIK